MLNIVKDSANKVKNGVSWLLGSDKVAEKINIQPKPKEDTVKLVTDIAADVSYVIEYLLKLHSCKSKKEFGEHVDRGALFYLASLKDKLVSLKNKLNDTEKANPSIKDFSIIKFCRSIIENDKINKELNDFSTKCSNLKQSNYYEEFSSHLDKIVKNFNIHQLQKKMSFLSKLEGKSDFSSLIKEYKNGWDVYDLLKEEGFKQYVKKTVIDDYTKLVKQGEEAASKCFGEEVEFQAFCTKADDGTYVLNVNVDRGSGSEPTQIEGESIQINDFLQKDVHELNVYRNKELEVWVHKYEDNRRDYEFKKGVSYEMTSTWPVKDESGKVSMCTMVMNVGNGGITKILKLNDGEEFEFQREDILELARKNSELRIQGCFLYDAINKYWGVQTGEKLRAAAEEGKKPGFTVPDVVPVAGRASQNTTTTLNQSNDKKPDSTDGPGSAGSAVATNTLLNNDASSKCIFPDSSSSTLPEAQSPSIPNLDPSPQGSDLATVNDALNKELGALKKEVFSLNEKLVESEYKAAPLKQKLTEHKEELETSRSESDELSQVFDIQKQMNKELETELTELQEVYQEVYKEKFGVERILEEREQEVLSLSKKVKEYEQEALELAQKDIEERHLLNQQLERAEAEKRKLEQDVEQKNERVRELEYKIKDQDELSRELEIGRQENQKLENRLEELSVENGNLHTQIQEIKVEKDKLSTALQENTQKFESAEKEKEVLKNKLRAAGTSNKELENRLKELTMELNRTQEAAEYMMNEYSKVIQDLKSQMLKLEQKNEEQQELLEQKVKDQKWEIEELKNNLSNKCQELEKEKEKFKEACVDIEEFKKKLDVLMIKIDEQAGEVKRLKDELEVKGEDLRCSAIKNGELILKIQELTSDLEVRSKELKQLVEDVKIYELGLVKDTKAYKLEKDEEIYKLEEIIIRQDRENENLKEENKDLTQDIEVLNKQLNTLNDNNTTDMSKITHLLENDPGVYMLVQALGDVTEIISPKKLSRSASLGSCDSGLDSDQELPSTEFTDNVSVSGFHQTRVKAIYVR